MAGRPRQPETPLYRVGAGLSGTDANGFLDLRYKYLAIPDPARLRRTADRFDRRTKILVRNDDFDLHLGQKVDDILGPPIKLGMSLLPAEAFRFEDGDSLDSGLLQRFLHLVEFERLDDRLDLLHFGQTPHPRASRRRYACRLRGKSGPAGRRSIASDRGWRYGAPLIRQKGGDCRQGASPIGNLAKCRAVS